MGDSDGNTTATPEAAPGARGWAQRVGLPALGALTLGALAVCVVSGIIVATGYEPGRAATSILAFEVSRPYGWFFRALHAWSAHLSLIGLVAHTIEYVARRSDRQTPAGNWIVLTGSLPVMAYLMLGGRALVGDTEAGGVAAVMHGLLSAVPALGPATADVLVGATPGGEMHALLTHHIATATLLLVVITVVHLKRLVPDAIATAVALGLAGGVALAVRPALAVTSMPTALRGPWFMGGLRLMLEHGPAWIVGLLLPAAMLALLGVLPVLSEARARVGRLVLLIVVVLYSILTAIAGWT